MKNLRKPKPVVLTPEAHVEGEQLQPGWNVGGTLHTSTIREWQEATFANGLATCADWVLSIKELDGKRTPTGGVFRIELDISTPDKYLLACRDLWQALTHSTHKHLESAPNQPIRPLATGAATAMGWLTVEGAADAEHR